MLSHAAIADGNGHWSIEQLRIPYPEGDEVLVKIHASGICHTDWDSMRWKQRISIGHEGAGTIVAVGPNVNGLNSGDRVILNWAVPCGTCFQCGEGNQHLCENSFVMSGNQPGKGHATPALDAQGRSVYRSFSLGTLAEFTLVRAAACVRFEHAIPFSSAAIVGCGVMTGYGSVVRAANVKPGRSVVVLGTGGVGLNIIQAARVAGAAMVIAVDRSAVRLGLATQFGATHTIQATADDPRLDRVRESVFALTQSRGADYCFESTAVPALGQAPLAMIRHGGMAVQVSGVEQEIAFDMRLFEWDKTYINPLYGQARPAEDFPAILDLYANGRYKLDELVSKTYSLEQLGTAFDDMLNGRIAKGVIVFHE